MATFGLVATADSFEIVFDNISTSIRPITCRLLVVICCKQIPCKNTESKYKLP